MDLLDWIKKDYLFIVMALIFVLGLLYVLNTQGSYQEKCNAHWRSEIERNCKTYKNLCAAYESNLTEYIFYNYTGDYRLIGVSNADKNPN